MANWQDEIKSGVSSMLANEKVTISKVHTEKTPERVAAAMAECISGYSEDPGKFLLTAFEDTNNNYDGMVLCSRIAIRSTCAHHLFPIIGQAHFAYVPDRKIVGLSKIPRFIDILCRRLQIQEQLSQEIVTTFRTYVRCLGCAVTIDAYHCCMMSRGVRVHDVVTRTTALRGCFLDNATTRAEFMAAVGKPEVLLT